jgi:ABC-type branched-subunit amino acid transport system ATPase component
MAVAVVMMRAVEQDDHEGYKATRSLGAFASKGHVAHAIGEAIAVADHAIVLDAGRVVASGPAGEVVREIRES